MSTQEIKDRLAQLERYASRTTLYLNVERVEDYFALAYRGVAQLGESTQRSFKLSVSLQSVLTFVGIGGEFEASRAEEVQRQIKPVMQAALLPALEALRGNLVRADGMVDVHQAYQTNSTAFVRFSGMSYLVDPGQDVTEARITALAAHEAETIQRERRRQEGRANDYRTTPVKSFVWVAPDQNPCLASVAFADWCRPGEIATLGRYLPFGVLGTFEEWMEGVMFIRPFWIWHERGDHLSWLDPGSPAPAGDRPPQYP